MDHAPLDHSRTRRGQVGVICARTSVVVESPKGPFNGSLTSCRRHGSMASPRHIVRHEWDMRPPIGCPWQGISGMAGWASNVKLPWVLNTYTIVPGTLLVPAWRLAHWYRRKKLFLVGVALVMLASALCG
jgi:hypothetical protein